MMNDPKICSEFYQDERISTATVSATPPCEHRNGWYHTVYFWIFKKRFMYCEDCHDLIPQSKRWTLI
jgi:hypothetical protein